MKYLKLFEENNIKQQPFFISKNDRLFVSDEFAKYIAQDISSYLIDIRDDFFGNVKNTYNSIINGKSHIWTTFKERVLNTNVKVFWSKNGLGENYVMNVRIYRYGDSYLNNESGKFKYYIGGISGDSEMHGKNMIRATRQCNINLIKKYFPIFEHIPYAHKKLQETPFFDVIKDSVKENPKLSKYLNEIDYPQDFSDFILRQQINKYNL